MCSKAADRLAQKQHEEIESDYERRDENAQSKDITPITPGMCFFFFLKIYFIFC